MSLVLMRKILCAVLSLGLYGSLFAQNTDEKVPTSTEPQNLTIDSLPAYSDIKLFYGYSQILKGYNDPFYVDDDKADYLNVPSSFLSFEFTRNMKMISQLKDSLAAENLLVGVSVLAHTIHFTKKVFLPVYPGINTQAQTHTIQSKSRFGMGFFLGPESTDYLISVGLTILLDFEQEKSRARLNPDTGKVEKVPGRGVILSKIVGAPSLRFRYGAERNIHFSFRVYQEQYNLDNDAVNMSISIPLGEHYALRPGVGLYPTGTFFLDNDFYLGDFNLTIRSGIVLNYYTDTLKVFGVDDALYTNIAMRYRFQ